MASRVVWSLVSLCWFRGGAVRQPLCFLAWGWGLAYLDQEDVCAGFGKGYGDGLADAPRGACHEGCLAFKGEECARGRGHDLLLSLAWCIDRDIRWIYIRAVQREKKA